MTASALLPRRRTVVEQEASALNSDAWDGYPLSLYSLLAFICENQIKGVVFLSGDEHVSSVTTAHVCALESGAQCTLHSIHSSGLFSPYPFGDASPDEFLKKDSFVFKVANTGTSYRCEVETTFFPGDGFALATAQNTRRAVIQVNLSESGKTVRIAPGNAAAFARQRPIRRGDAKAEALRYKVRIVAQPFTGTATNSRRGCEAKL